MFIINKQFGLLLLFLLPFFVLHGQNFRNITLTGGFSLLEKNEGANLPALDDLHFRYPFFFTFEGRFSEPFAVQTGLFTNEPDLTDGSRPFMIGGHVSAQWYFDQHIFNNQDLEWSLGAGVGIYRLERRASQGTYGFNTLFRYWIFERVGISFQWMANFGFTQRDLVKNFYQYNFGIVWGSKIKKKQRNAYTESLEDIQEEIPSERKKVIVDITPVETEEEVVDDPTPEPEPQVVEPEPIEVESVYFDRNSSYFDRAEAQKLDGLIETLLGNQAIRVKIEAYTDSSGDSNYNQWLADRRLKRTTDYLVNGGIDPTRIVGISVGIDPESIECLDVPSPCTVESQRQYRRTQFLLFDQ